MKEVALCTPKVISPIVEERNKSAAKIARECFDLDVTENVYINASHVQWPLPTRSTLRKPCINRINWYRLTIHQSFCYYTYVLWTAAIIDLPQASSRDPTMETSSGLIRDVFDFDISDTDTAAETPAHEKCSIFHEALSSPSAHRKLQYN